MVNFSVVKFQIAVQRQKAAFPPNFVHSLDSSHMMMTAITCKKAGLHFAGMFSFLIPLLAYIFRKISFQYWPTCCHSNETKTKCITAYDLLHFAKIELHICHVHGDLYQPWIRMLYLLPWCGCAIRQHLLLCVVFPFCASLLRQCVLFINTPSVRK
jgi:hypothetical protein